MFDIVFYTVSESGGLWIVHWISTNPGELVGQQSPVATAFGFEGTETSSLAFDCGACGYVHGN